MSDYQKDAVSGQRFVTVSDNLQVNEVVVDRFGPLKGFVYHTPIPKNVAGALAIFGGDEGAMLDALASKVQAMVYVRVANKLKTLLPQDQKEGETTRTWLDRHVAEIEAIKLENPVLFGIEDAQTFKPGERELTPAGLIRLLGKTQQAASKDLAEGRMEDAVKKFSEIAEIMQRINAYTELLRKQAESDSQDA
jgi:hypothetical protein